MHVDRKFILEKGDQPARTGQDLTSQQHLFFVAIEKSRTSNVQPRGPSATSAGETSRIRLEQWSRKIALSRTTAWHVSATLTPCPSSTTSQTNWTSPCSIPSGLPAKNCSSSRGFKSSHKLK